MAGKAKLRRILLRILGSVAALLLLALLWIALIVGQPQPTGRNTTAEQPPLTASPAVDITAETEIPKLLEGFPAPALSFLSGSGMTFVRGTAADAAADGSLARTVTLYWQTGDEKPMILQSIYPASAMCLLEGNGYSFSAGTGPVLCGLTSVRMENGGTVRLHIRTDEGIYSVTVPAELAGDLSVLTKSLQLFTLN